MGGSGDHCVKGNKPGSKRQISSFLLYAASIRVTDILLSIKYSYNFMHIICITKFIMSIKNNSDTGQLQYKGIYNEIINSILK